MHDSGYGYNGYEGWILMLISLGVIELYVLGLISYIE